MRNFESLYLTQNTIDFETTKLDFSYPWILGILRAWIISGFETKEIHDWS